jgi:hypothetical protein
VVKIQSIKIIQSIDNIEMLMIIIKIKGKKNFKLLAKILQILKKGIGKEVGIEIYERWKK